MALMQVFERYEKKYLLTPPQYDALRRSLTKHFHTDAYGRHTIGSIYYDTQDYQLIETSLAKPSYKEKLRLRAYGTPQETDTVFLEIKKKVKGVVYKRRVPLTLEQSRLYDSQGIIPDPESQIWHEIDWMYYRYALTPKVLIACERIALYGIADTNLRITFDFDIRFRSMDLDLALGTEGTPLAPGFCLMEVKIPGAMPLFLAHLFAEMGLTAVSFSKYGTAYRNYLSRIPATTGGHYA